MYFELRMKHCFLIYTVFMIQISVAQTDENIHVIALNKSIKGCFDSKSLWSSGKRYVNHVNNPATDSLTGKDPCKTDLQIRFRADRTGTYYTGHHVNNCKKQEESFTWKIKTILVKDQPTDILTITINRFDFRNYEIIELSSKKLRIMGDFNLGGDSTTEGLLELIRTKKK
jgi:hypothetical protein